MPEPVSVTDLDLTPPPGHVYFNTVREWREEFIYFLLVDRFHDDKATRSPVLQKARASGFGTSAQLDNFCGGTIRGIINQLDYIQGLGCTALWLSPVFENNPNAYHGYAIQNYLKIDPRFGTKQDLIDLVAAAHRKGMRVILDVVINHSGDNWQYPGGFPFFFDPSVPGGRQFDLDKFRTGREIVPEELRKKDLYHRRGEIRQGRFDDFPETENGDVFSLKDFAHGDSAEGSEVVNLLIQAHCWWIREADIDGFRVDAVKHLGPLASSRFCSMIREYAYRLGKREFFLFGEVATGDDEILDRFIGQNTSEVQGGKTVFFGQNSLLDFPLHFALPGVIKGLAPPDALFQRLERQRDRALNRGEIGRYLVTFADNHDQIGQNPHRRIGAGTPDEQVIACMGYLLCSLGTPCIYYGTEQGFSGVGGDADIREAMFSLSNNTDTRHNPDCSIYKEIARIARIMRAKEPLRFGRMYFREISGNGTDFGLPYGGRTYTLAFSRLLYGEEVLVAYNVSDKPRNDFVLVDGDIHQNISSLRYLYRSTIDDIAVSAAPPLPILSHPDPKNTSRFVQLNLAPREFVILTE